MSTEPRVPKRAERRDMLVFVAFAAVYVGIASVASRPLAHWWRTVGDAVVRDVGAVTTDAVLLYGVAALVLAVVVATLVAVLAPPSRRRRLATRQDAESVDATPVDSAFERAAVTLAGGEADTTGGYPIATWPDAEAGATPRAPTALLAPTRSIEDLCRDFAEVCESAVDPLEIACALEWEGINDAAVQRIYGFNDVFSLAEEMYLRVPRRPRDPAPAPDPWATASWRRPAFHGLLYGLPAICYPAASSLLVGANALAMLVVALLVGWTLSQTVALLGYRRLVPSDLVPARQALRVGLVAGLGVALVVLLVAQSVLHTPIPMFWFAVGEASYMLGSSALFVLGRERLVLVSLVPSVAACTIFLATGRPDVLLHATWACLALSPILVVSFGLACTRTPRTERRRALALDELRAVLPAAAFGFCAAGLLAFPAAAGLHGNGGVNPGVLLATLPISLSMGGAEWCLLWYRRRTRRLLRTSFDLRTFARKSRFTLAFATFQYAALAVVLVVLTVVIAAVAGLLHPHPDDAAQVVAYLLLGVAMFLSLSLQAMGLRAVALLAAASALAYEIAFRAHGVTAQLVACGGLVLVVGAYALFELGAATRHSM